MPAPARTVEAGRPPAPPPAPPPPPPPPPPVARWLGPAGRPGGGLAARLRHRRVERLLVELVNQHDEDVQFFLVCGQALGQPHEALAAHGLQPVALAQARL